MVGARKGTTTRASAAGANMPRIQMLGIPLASLHAEGPVLVTRLVVEKATYRTSDADSKGGERTIATVRFTSSESVVPM
jgi:hypothetical protein